MKFSILVPAHNAESFLKKALESVRMQTLKDYELIVACDACEDRTARIAKRYADKALILNFASEGLTRNALLDAASGEWILWIDDDDWWMHEYVLEELERNLGNVDTLSFSFIWKDKGYRAAGDYVAVWTRAWRRAWLGDMRFSDCFPTDWDFYQRMKKKPGVHKTINELMYYYNYMREGSQWELVERNKS